MMQVSSTITKTLLILVAVVSFLLPVLSYFFHAFGLPILSPYLALSLAGLKSGFPWQLVSYPFLQSMQLNITISFLFALTFHLLLLSFLGKTIERLFGSWRLLFLFFGSTVVGAAFFVLYGWLFHSPKFLFGLAVPLCALLAVYAKVNSDVNYYFLTIRLEIKWIFIALLIFFLLSTLVNHGWGGLLAAVASLLFGIAFPTLFKKNKPRKVRSDKIIDITDFK